MRELIQIEEALEEHIAHHRVADLALVARGAALVEGGTDLVWGGRTGVSTDVAHARSVCKFCGITTSAQLRWALPYLIVAPSCGPAIGRVLAQMSRTPVGPGSPLPQLFGEIYDAMPPAAAEAIVQTLVAAAPDCGPRRRAHLHLGSQDQAPRDRFRFAAANTAWALDETSR
jgi:hypothetical protein